MKRVLVIANQHGNEPLGLMLKTYMEENKPELLYSVSYIIGNPKAQRNNVRYIESDMNRSYDCGSDTYEKRRSKVIQSHIKKLGPDLVLDMHTTNTRQNTCIIYHHYSPNVRKFISSTHITNSVRMPKPIVNNSLIGICEQALSVEVSIEQLDSIFLANLCKDIDRYLLGICVNMKKQHFEIFGKIMNTEHPQRLKNFELSTYGYYPVLFGNNTYRKQTDYLGFKANIVEHIQL